MSKKMAWLNGLDDSTEVFLHNNTSPEDGEKHLRMENPSLEDIEAAFDF